MTLLDTIWDYLHADKGHAVMKSQIVQARVSSIIQTYTTLKT
jgi:hypothetical protein